LGTSLQRLLHSAEKDGRAFSLFNASVRDAQQHLRYAYSDLIAHHSRQVVVMQDGINRVAAN